MGMIIAQAFALGFSGAILPGPFQAYLLAQTMKIGWKRTIPAIGAPLISDGPIVTLVLFVLTTVPLWLLRTLYIGGGIFLVFLGWRAYQAFRSNVTLDALASETAAQNFLKAVLVNFISPGPYIFWSLITGPLLLSYWHTSPWHAASFLCSFYASFIGMLGVLVVLFGIAREAGPLIVRGLLGVSSLILTGFGLYQLMRGLLP